MKLGENRDLFIGFINIGRSRNIKREFLIGIVEIKVCLSGLSENKSRIIGYIEFRKIFKIIFVKRKEKNGIVV